MGLRGFHYKDHLKSVVLSLSKGVVRLGVSLKGGLRQAQDYGEIISPV